MPINNFIGIVRFNKYRKVTIIDGITEKIISLDLFFFEEILKPQ